MSVRIIVDSSTDVGEQYRSRIEVVPLTLHFGDQEYFDGVTIDKQEFYRKLVESDVQARSTVSIFGSMAISASTPSRTKKSAPGLLA